MEDLFLKIYFTELVLSRNECELMALNKTSKDVLLVHTDPYRTCIHMTSHVLRAHKIKTYVTVIYSWSYINN